MQEDSARIDPDPFLIAALCMQGAAVILQLVQIYKQAPGGAAAVRPHGQRKSVLTQLESALEDFDTAIMHAERAIRRSSDNPNKELYEVSFRISLGVLSFESKRVEEYHNDLADISAKLSALTRWIGHLIMQDIQLSKEFGEEIDRITPGSADRLNGMMAEGAEISSVLNESKLVRDACKAVVTRRLNDRSN